MPVVWDDEQPAPKASGKVIWDDETPPPDANVIQRSPGLLGKLGGRLSDIGTYAKSATNPLTPGYRPALGIAGAVAGAAGDVIGAGLGYLPRKAMEEAKTLPGKPADSRMPFTNIEPKIADFVNSAIKMGGEAYDWVKKKYPKETKDVENLIAVGTAASALEPAKEAVEIGAQELKGVAKGAKELIKPTPTKQEALGQILQGKTKDIIKGERALSAVDTTGVKTYGQLQAKLGEAIPELSRQVDAELLKDPRAYKLGELSTVGKSAGESEVQQNFVETSLNHLKELYTKINDPVSAKNAEELLQKAETQGLTKKEVNDIARKYNVEFKDKAFSSQTGDPLTSVNAQAYENVRSGLKEVSRRGLSPAAKELDETMSSIYNTKRLVDKNVEAVRKLRQKVDERGLGERFGGLLANAADTLSLGTAKGFVQKMFPRNVGYKMKNWMDLEKSLDRNLKIINKANAATTNKEMRQSLFELRKEIKALPKAAIEVNPPRPIGQPALPPHYGPEPAPFGANIGQSARQAQFDRMKAGASARRGKGPGQAGADINRGVVTRRGKVIWEP